MNIYENFNPLPLDLQGWNGNSSIFSEVIDQVNPKTIIEVGTWKGQSAITMAEHCKSKGLETKIYCVDTWLGSLEFFDESLGMLSSEFYRQERDLRYVNGYPSVYYQFLSNVVHTNNEGLIIPIPNTSIIASRYFKNQNVEADLIYIDASHEYDDVSLDLKAYFPLLKSGGIMFGDDYINEWFGVVRAVNEFANKYFLEIEVRENNFWILRKP
jgi:hypothetical protein